MNAGVLGGAGVLPGFHRKVGACWEQQVILTAEPRAAQLVRSPNAYISGHYSVSGAPRQLASRGDGFLTPNHLLTRKVKVDWIPTLLGCCNRPTRVPLSPGAWLCPRTVDLGKALGPKHVPWGHCTPTSCTPWYLMFLC